eukprot:2974211-Pyramimonas_sp.AAC.1
MARACRSDAFAIGWEQSRGLRHLFHGEGSARGEEAEVHRVYWSFQEAVSYTHLTLPTILLV